MHLLLVAVICFFEITVILFVSALTKSSIGTVAILSVGLLLPMFIPFSENSRLFNRLLALTIARIVDLQECLVTFMDYQIGSYVLDLPTFAIIEHLMVGVILVCLVRRIYVWRGLRA